MKKILTIALLLVLSALAAYGIFSLVKPDRSLTPPGQGLVGTPPADIAQSRQVDLFFADLTGRRLSLERREVAGENREDLLKRVVEELIRGPNDDTRIRTLPESVLVRAVFSRDRTVWVDLGGSIREDHPGGAWTEVLAVYSLVNTLTENFTDVNQVQILLNGRESDTFAGHVDISRPLENRIQLLAGDWE